MSGGALYVSQDNEVRVLAFDHFTTDWVNRVLLSASFKEMVLPNRTIADRDFMLFYPGHYRTKNDLAELLDLRGPRPLLVVAVNADGDAFDMNPRELMWVCTHLVAAEHRLVIPKELTA